MGSQHTTARLDSTILGSGDGCSDRGGSTGSSRPRMVAMEFLSLVGNSFGCSASGERLVSAARDGDVQEAKALLEYNPRLARYSTFGVRNSPLHYSAAQGHHEIVSLLLESGVDINIRNYGGQTALMQACQYGHWECKLVNIELNEDQMKGELWTECQAVADMKFTYVVSFQLYSIQNDQETLEHKIY
ncbi:hypothetical protein OROMI_022957 [Orobanche minor]